MTDIELVINIPEELYETYKGRPSMLGDAGMDMIVQSIANGTPLPKGHGDLIDKSKIHKAIPAEEDNCTGMGMTLEEMDAYNDGIDAMYDKVQRVNPIIEADKESEECNSTEEKSEGLIGEIPYESLNFILDLLDEYIELKKQMMMDQEEKKENFYDEVSE